MHDSFSRSPEHVIARDQKRHEVHKKSFPHREVEEPLGYHARHKQDGCENDAPDKLLWVFLLFLAFALALFAVARGGFALSHGDSPTNI